LAMLDKALALAQNGFAVFPLSPNSKRPLPGSRGFYEASFDQDIVRQAWASSPDSNIGIYPDACRNRLMVVDLDVKNGEDGRETLAILEMEHGDLPPTLQVRTPGGGTHVYLVVPDGHPPVPSSVRRVGPGIDIRSHGGYVVAFGCEVDGKPYEVLTPPVIAVAPEWLISLAGTAPERHADADKLAPGIADWDLMENRKRALEWLQREARAGRVATAGRGGNSFTYQTAEVVRDFGITEQLCVDFMRDGWNPLCQPPWEDGELAQIVANAYAYAKRPAGASRNASPEALDRMAQLVAERPKETGDAPKPASRFRLLTWANVMSMAPPTWMVEGTLPERGVIEIYGPYSSYKSFLALDMALSLAHGVEWAGRRVDKPRNVVYTAGEGAYGMRARAAAWAEAHKLQSVSGFALMPTMPLFGDADDLRGFGEAIAAHQPEFIVVDTTAHAMAGLDENTQKDAGTFMARVFELRDAFRTAVLLVHHTGKDASRGSRGSTAIPAACDTIFAVEAPRSFQALLKMEKQKDAEAWKAPQGFQGTIVGSSLVFNPAAISPQQEDAEQLRVEALVAILEGLRGATIETKPLAWEIAGVVNPHLDEPGREKLASAVRQWLNRAARERQDLQRFIASRAAGRGEVNIWRFPVGETNGTMAGN
jgi:hypothetical protein